MSSKKRSKIIYLILVLIGAGGFIGYKMTYKAHKTIQELKVDYKGSADKFISELSNDPGRWQGKIVQLHGMVSQVDDKGFMLNESIYCRKNEKLKETISETTHTVKGRIIGYDDLLEELKLDKVILIK